APAGARVSRDSSRASPPGPPPPARGRGNGRAAAVPAGPRRHSFRPLRTTRPPCSRSSSRCDPPPDSIVILVNPRRRVAISRAETPKEKAAMRSCLRWTAAVLALTLAGCAEQPTGVPANGDAGNEAGSPRLTVLLRDAPGDVVEAVVTIWKVYLQGNGRVTLMDEPVTTDLLELANSALTLVDGEDVPAGAYSELRFVITGGYIAVEQDGGGLRYYASSPSYEGLPDGVTASGTLHMPSYAQS